MKIKEALRLSDGNTIPSLTVEVVYAFGVKQTSIGAISTYGVRDDTGDAILRFIQPSKKILWVGCLYSIKSIPTEKGLRGITINIFKDKKQIDCSQVVRCDILGKVEQPEEEMSQELPPVPPAPYTATQHVNIQLRRYFEIKDKALTKGITEQHAHEIALKLIFPYPQGFFGEKDQI